MVPVIIRMYPHLLDLGSMTFIPDAILCDDNGHSENK